MKSCKPVPLVDMSCIPSVFKLIKIQINSNRMHRKWRRGKGLD